MSAATAERLLRSHRASTPRGVCCTQVGSLLKQQIPIRTFHGWDNAQSGFLEADLVAHNGGDSEGCSLYTLTLTDVATGWTECLPLLYKNPEAVLAAFQQARALFPFPILGLDTDNGSEVINETLLLYCEAQQITFTQGRPDLKADQCFVEQKNGAIMRQFVGFDRLVGQPAYRLKAGVRGKGQDEGTPLFLSETYEPPTSNALTLVFHRLSKRAGITQQRITPSLLHDSFAIQYLQAGGEPATLRALLGLKDRAALHRYERFLVQSMEPQEQNEPTEGDVSRSIAAPHQRKQHREPGAICNQKPARRTTRGRRSQPTMQQGTHEWGGSGGDD